MDENKKHQGDEVKGDKGKIIIKGITGSVSEVYGGDHTEVHNTYNEESEETRKFRKVIADFFNGLNKLGQSLFLLGVGIVLVFVLIVLPLKIVNWAIVTPAEDEYDMMIEDITCRDREESDLVQYQDEDEIVSFYYPDHLFSQNWWSRSRENQIKLNLGCGVNSITVTLSKTPWKYITESQWANIKTLSVDLGETDFRGGVLKTRNYQQEGDRRYGIVEYKEAIIDCPGLIDIVFDFPDSWLGKYLKKEAIEHLEKKLGPADEVIWGSILDFDEGILLEVQYSFTASTYQQLSSIWNKENFKVDIEKAKRLLQAKIDFDATLKNELKELEYNRKKGILIKFLRINPRSIGFLIQLAALETAYEKDLPQALKLCDIVLKQIPDDSTVLQLRNQITQKLENQTDE